jgi:hypothetical protein
MIESPYHYYANYYNSGNYPGTSHLTARSVNKQHTFSTENAKNVLGAAGLFGIALLLHRLPKRLPEDGLKTILPTDWKVWARIGLGLMGLKKLNQGLNVQLPSWLQVLQTLVVINPLVVGFGKNSFKQMALMSPFIVGTVEGTRILQNHLQDPAQQKLGISPLMTRLLVSATVGLLALLGYPRLYKAIASTGIAGKEFKNKAENELSTLASASFTTCARGCTPGSFICLSELAEIGGSLFQSFSVIKPSQHNNATLNSNPDPSSTTRIANQANINMQQPFSTVGSVSHARQPKQCG